MRFRAGLTLGHPVVFALVFAMGVILNAGCGGGSSDPRPQPTVGGTPTPRPTPTPPPNLPPVNVRTTIKWGPRSRQLTTNAVSGPSSALSAIITLRDPSTGAVVLAYPAERGATSQGDVIYTSPGQVRPGLYNLSVEFFANPNGVAPLVGTAAASATVLADGRLTTTIATFGTIQQVEVPENQSVTIGETLRVVYTARDRDRNVLALTPGSAFVQIVDATSTVTDPNGQVRPSAQVSPSDQETIVALNPANVKLRVSVDGALSPVVDVRIRSRVVLTVTPNSPTVSILRSVVFNATVQNDGPTGSQGVRYALVQGPTAGTLTPVASNPLAATFTATRNEGEYTVRVTSVYDPNVSVDIPLTVRSLVAVTITPAAPGTVSINGGQVDFDATVSEVPEGQDAGVTWRVESVTPANVPAGSITPEGLYTATAAGRKRVTATSNFDGRRSASVEFDVASLAVVRVTPTNPDPISIRTSRQFTAVVDGVPAGQDAGVVWSVRGGNANGTITPDGTYTAPATPGDYVIVATSRFDITKTAEVTVPVRSFVNVTVPIVNVEQSIRETRTYTATVTGVPEGFDTGVTWSLQLAPGQPGGTDPGTINAATGQYTSPANPVDVILTATSRFDPTKAAQVRVAVRSFVTISITPAGPVLISINGQRQFAANVGGVGEGGDTGVDWTVLTPGGGTINASGLYRAPGTPGDYTIQARSRFDPTRTATVIVQVRSGDLGVGVN